MREPITTAAETGRYPNETESDETTESKSFIPTEIWIRQYQKEARLKRIAGLNQFARTRELTVAGAGGKVDDYEARELVLDALVDTWLGVVRWDPDKCSLGRAHDRGRADKHRKQALQRQHDALGGGTAASRFAEYDASELVGDDQLPVTRVHASDTSGSRSRISTVRACSTGPRIATPHIAVSRPSRS